MSAASPRCFTVWPSLGLQVEGAVPWLRRLWAGTPVPRRYVRRDVPESQRGDPSNHPGGYVCSSPVARWASVPGTPEGTDPESLYQRLAMSDLAAAAFLSVAGPELGIGAPAWICGMSGPGAVGPDKAVETGAETWACWLPGSNNLQAVRLAGWPEPVPLRWFVGDPRDHWGSVPRAVVDGLLGQIGLPLANDGFTSGPLSFILANHPPGKILVFPAGILPDQEALHRQGLYTFTIRPSPPSGPVYYLLVRATSGADTRQPTAGGSLTFSTVGNLSMIAAGDARLERRAAWWRSGCPLTPNVQAILGYPAPGGHIARAEVVLSVRHDKGDGARLYPLDMRRR